MGTPRPPHRKELRPGGRSPPRGASAYQPVPDIHVNHSHDMALQEVREERSQPFLLRGAD